MREDKAATWPPCRPPVPGAPVPLRKRVSRHKRWRAPRKKYGLLTFQRLTAEPFLVVWRIWLKHPRMEAAEPLFAELVMSRHPYEIRACAQRLREIHNELWGRKPGGKRR